jgi:predicted O-methyltransferase YrrM
VLWGRQALVEALDLPKLEPAPGSCPESLETGTQNHEGIVGAAAAVEFLASLADGKARRARLDAAFKTLHARGQQLVERLWAGLREIDGVAVHGPPPSEPRTPTVSFSVRGLASQDVARALAERAVFVSNGDFYATAAVARLGHAADGVVRAGCACYTTRDEVERLLDGVRALRQLGRTVMKKATSTLGSLVVLLALAAPVFPQAAANPHEMHRRHNDPMAYIASLDDPGRDAYQKPDEVMRALALRAGEVVADIGAGSGYFALRFARAVGDSGRVYAVDISPDMVRHLNRRLRDAGVRNVVTVLSDPDDPLLPDASVDRFVIVDTWHHVEDQAKYLTLLKRMLKPGGQVVHIDFQKRELPIGPPVGMKIAREDLVKQMEGAGFRLAAEHTFLPYQYFLVFSR